MNPQPIIIRLPSIVPLSSSVLASFSSLFLLLHKIHLSSARLPVAELDQINQPPLIINFSHCPFLEKATVCRYGFMSKLIKRTPSHRPAPPLLVHLQSLVFLRVLSSTCLKGVYTVNSPESCEKLHVISYDNRTM